MFQACKAGTGSLPIPVTSILRGEAVARQNNQWRIATSSFTTHSRWVVHNRILYLMGFGTLLTTTRPSYDRDAKSQGSLALQATLYTLSSCSSKQCAAGGSRSSGPWRVPGVEGLPVASGRSGTCHRMTWQSLLEDNRSSSWKGLIRACQTQCECFPPKSFTGSFICCWLEGPSFRVSQIRTLQSSPALTRWKACCVLKLRSLTGMRWALETLATWAWLRKSHN
mmetsp:Transcript_19860/g.55252  ORF Transcript_19860/g.55252 Transcript_19860/m.55252 type:complete len:224 (-) Transcript_19860:818-1489(-)